MGTPLRMADFRVPRLVANFALLSGGEFISKLFTLAAFAYLARILGPGAFGTLEFALALIFFCTLLVDCGLSSYGARELAKGKGSVARLTVHVILVRSVLAAGAFACLTAFVALIDQAWPVKQLILLYGLTLFELPGLLPWVFQGHDRMPYVAVASVTRWSIFAAGVLLFVGGPERVWMVPLIEGGAIGCVLIFYLWAASRVFGSLWQRIDYAFAWSLFREASPIGASELVWAIKIYFATILLGILMAGPEVAWFGASHRIVISLHTFVWLYFFNLLPSIARCTEGPFDVLNSLMQRSIQGTAWIVVFLGIIGTAFAGPFITLLYGSQYRDAAHTFQVLIWLVPLALMSGHYRYALIAYDKQRLEFATALCGAGVNVLLNLLLVRRYGGLGAAWALIASEAFIWGLAYYFVRRTIATIPLWPCVYRPVVGGAILASALYLLPPVNLWMAAGSAVLLYGLVLSIAQPRILADIGLVFPRHR